MCRRDSDVVYAQPADNTIHSWQAAGQFAGQQPPLLEDVVGRDGEVLGVRPAIRRKGSLVSHTITWKAEVSSPTNWESMKEVLGRIEGYLRSHRKCTDIRVTRKPKAAPLEFPCNVTVEIDVPTEYCAQMLTKEGAYAFLKIEACQYCREL